MAPAESGIFFGDVKNVSRENTIKRFHKPGGDHLTLLNVYREFKENSESSFWCKENFLNYKSMIKAMKIKDQLINLCERVEIFVDKSKLESNLSADEYVTNMNIRKSICSGFFYNTAKYYRDSFYKTIKNDITVLIHPSSSICKETPNMVIYNELVYTSKEYMRNVLEINPEWLTEVAPHYFRNMSINVKEDK